MRDKVIPRNFKIGDIVTIKSKAGHAFKVGEKVEIVGIYYHNAHCFNGAYYQYVGWHQIKKEIILNKATKTL